MCGVSNGTGGLNLTIADGSGNVLAQSTAYLQIVDIKQMYERWTVGDQPNVAPTTNAVSGHGRSAAVHDRRFNTRSRRTPTRLTFFMCMVGT